MHRLTRPHDDHGAVAVLVAIMMAIVLLGFGAIVVDVGGLYAERRQLQNGADAASLAVAATCVGSACDTSTAATGTAGTLAGPNANDTLSAVDLVCGTGSGLPPCPAPQGPWDCPPLPSGALAAAKYAQVQTSTRQPGGSTLVPPRLARLLSGNGGYPGTTVRACSRASWGPAQSVNVVLPLTMSRCEWYGFTANGTSFVIPPPPPFTSSTVWPAENQVYFHNTTQAPSCGQGPSGADLAGGFGWLEVSSGCGLSVGVDGWYDDSTGRQAPNGCDSLLSSLVGTVVDVPVYDETNGLTGSNGQYAIGGFAPFFVTGYFVNGSQYRTSLVDGKKFCASGSASDSCIKGFFTKDLTPNAGVIGGGTSYGTTVIQMSG